MLEKQKNIKKNIKMDKWR